MNKTLGSFLNITLRYYSDWCWDENGELSTKKTDDFKLLTEEGKQKGKELLFDNLTKLQTLLVA
jgi:hypothetical protein